MKSKNSIPKKSVTDGMSLDEGGEVGVPSGEAAQPYSLRKAAVAVSIGGDGDVTMKKNGLNGKKEILLPCLSRIGPIIGSDIANDSDINRWVWDSPRWPSFRWNQDAVAASLAEAREAQAALQGTARVLQPAIARSVVLEVLKQEGLSTSAIEGHHLNPESVAASVARHLGIPWDGVPPTRDTDAVVGLLVEATAQFDRPLSVERLCEWQSSLFPGGWSGLQRITAGALRAGEVVVAHGRIGGEIVDFAAVPRNRLEPELDRFLDWMNSSNGQMDGLIRAAVAHLWFVTLHPFEDGNGRLTRAITDMAISQDEGESERLFRMSSRIMKVRENYYEVLKAAQSSHNVDITPWLTWFLEQAKGACVDSRDIVRGVLAKGAFWAVHRSDGFSPSQSKVLNRLLDAGPDGFEGGMTARKYVAMTRVSKATATRELGALVEMGCFVSTGIGRGTAYRIPWEKLMITTE